MILVLHWSQVHTVFLGPVNLIGFCIVYKVCTFKWLRNVFIVRGTLRKISHPEERMKNLTNKRVGGYTKPPHKFCCHLTPRSFHRGVTVRRAARVMTGHSLFFFLSFFCQLLFKYSNVSHQTGWRGSVVRRSVGGQGVLITTVSREEGCKRPLWLVSIRVAWPLTPDLWIQVGHQQHRVDSRGRHLQGDTRRRHQRAWNCCHWQTCRDEKDYICIYINNIYMAFVIN